MLNSRLLSPISQNPTELRLLTPEHFLRVAPIISTPQNNLHMPSDKISHLNRWEKLKAMQHFFVERWKSEYLTTLLQMEDGDGEYKK